MATIRVKAGIDSTQYKRAIDEMQRKNTGFKNKLGGIQDKMRKAFALGAVVAFIAIVKRAIGSLVQFGSKMTDMGYQTGLSVESFQALERAVRNAGGETNHLVNGLSKLRDAQGDVIRGDLTATEAFEDLGLSIQQVASLDAEGLFTAVAKAVTDAGNSGKAFSAASDVLGRRNLPRLLEAMNEVAKAGGDIASGFGELENVNAQALDAMADKWANFWADVKELSANVLGAVVRGLSRLFTGRDIGAERAAQDEKRRAIERVNREREASELIVKQRKEEAEKLRKESARDKVSLKIRDLEESDLADLQSQLQAAGVTVTINPDMDVDAAKRLVEDALDAEKLRAELGKVTAKIEIQTDQFRAIGGRLGGSITPELQVARQQLSILEQQNEILSRVEGNTREPTGALV